MPLVHADTSDRASIRIQKRPDGFVFRNPGTLRVPAAHALQGGESDCRNRTLHQLFLQLGLGERAGSGLPKIRAAWEPMGYSVHLHDTFEPYDQSILEMSRVGKGPEEVPNAPVNSPEKSSEKSSEKMSVKTDARILELLRTDGHLAISDLATALELSTRAIEKQLRKMQNSGRLRRIGPDKGGHWEVLP